MTLRFQPSLSNLLRLFHFYFTWLTLWRAFSFTCPGMPEYMFELNNNYLHFNYVYSPKFEKKDWGDQCTKNGWVYKFRIEFGTTYEKAGVAPPLNTPVSSVMDLYDDPRPSHWFVSNDLISF